MFFILILVRYFCVFSFAHIPLVKIFDFYKGDKLQIGDNQVKMFPALQIFLY